MFGKRRLSEISPAHVMDLLKDKAAAGLKPKSLLNLYVLLQKMLNLAVALELLNSNPMQRVPKPKWSEWKSLPSPRLKSRTLRTTCPRISGRWLCFCT